eukprot:COSAG06_NODE_23787_length_681_cov_1.321306_1_plen_73_part_01
MEVGSQILAGRQRTLRCWVLRWISGVEVAGSGAQEQQQQGHLAQRAHGTPSCERVERAHPQQQCTSQWAIREG